MFRKRDILFYQLQNTRMLAYRPQLRPRHLPTKSVARLKCPKVTCVPVHHDKRDVELHRDSLYVSECWYSLCNSKAIKKNSTTNVKICDSHISVSRTKKGRITCQQWRVRELGGIIFVYLGTADELPPIFKPKQFGKKGWAHVHDEVSVCAPHFTVFSNVIDQSHVPVVHQKSTNNQFKSLADVKLKVDDVKNTLTFTFPILPKFNLYGYACATLPSNSFIEFRLPFGLRYIVFGMVQPVDQYNSIIRFCSIRNILPYKMFNSIFLKAMHTVLSEDKEILEMLRPDDQEREFSGFFDVPQLTFRRLRDKYIDTGKVLN